MELPKRARTVKLENNVLTLDGEKKFEISDLSMDLMEHLAGYALVGFYVDGYKVTDKMLSFFAGHKSMTNFGVENGALTDACLHIFATMPKLRYLLLDGNSAITGSNLSTLQGCKLDLLSLNRTGLDDAGLLKAASIPKLSHIQIDHSAVTFEGLLSIAGNKYIKPVSHVQFSKEQMDHFTKLQRERAKKTDRLNEQDVAQCQSVLSDFFARMTQWEQYMEQSESDENALAHLRAIFGKYVSQKPRQGFRPLCISYCSQGTYSKEEFLDAEQITKNKIYIYTRDKDSGFERRFLMKRVDDNFMIDDLHERLDGWQSTGL